MYINQTQHEKNPVINRLNYAMGNSRTYVQTIGSTPLIEELRRSGTNSPPATVVHIPPVTRVVRILSTTKGPRVPTLVDKVITVRRRNKRGVFVKKTFTIKKSVLKRSRIPCYRYVNRTSREKYLNVRARTVNALNYRKTHVKLEYPIFRRTAGLVDPLTGPSYVQSYSGDTWSPFNLLDGTAVGLSHEGFLQASLPDFARVRNDSLIKLHSKISDIKSNLAQVIAEREQTMSLLADAVSRLSSAYKDFRRRDLASAVTHLFPTSSKQLANDFLAFKFGVLPLISDIEGMLQNLSSFDISNKTVSAKQVESVDRVLWTQTAGGLKYEVREFLSYTVKTSARLRFQSELSRSFQKLGLTNLAGLAWELLPWSFVADWALPIGSWINSLENLAQVDVENSWETTLYSREVVCEVTSLPVADSNGYIWDYQIQKVWSFKQFSCVRSPGTSLSISPFFFKRSFLNTSHLELALALFRQKW